MEEDKLTAEEREAIAELCTVGKSPRAAVLTMKLMSALYRLAPPPKPPEPRVSELPARWRAHAEQERRDAEGCVTTAVVTYEACADELEAALGRERDRIGSDAMFERLADAAEARGPCDRVAARKVTAAILDVLLRELQP